MMTRMFNPLRGLRQTTASRFAWMAAGIVLLAAMLPSLGMVLREATSGRITVEICSAHGSRFIELALADTPESPARDAGVVHCPLCVTASGGSSLPPQTAGVAVVATATAPLVEREIPALPVPAFTIPISRAPPLRLI